MTQQRFVVFLLILMLPLSGCTSSLGTGLCGQGYDEMYGGYDYSFTSISMDSDNTLNVSIVLLNGGGGWLEESEEHEASQELYFSFDVKMADGSEHSVGYGSTTWAVNGDQENGSYWMTNLYFQSPDGFCDLGCQEVRLSVGYEDGVIYYDGTCDSSPWIDIPQ